MTSAVAADLETLPTGPAPDGHDQPYWQGLREGRLLLPRCAGCATWRPLGRVICPECWSAESEWCEVAPAGTVFSWIRTHRDFMSELDVRAPYVTVLVELTGAPLKLLGILRADEVAIGDEVRGVVESPANAEWPVLRWVAA